MRTKANFSNRDQVNFVIRRVKNIVNIISGHIVNITKDWLGKMEEDGLLEVEVMWFEVGWDGGDPEAINCDCWRRDTRWL